MQSYWLIRNNRDKLLLMFNGWGMDAQPFKRLDSDIFDVLVLYDYRSLDWDGAVLDELRPYAEPCVLAWSMGVWAAGQALSQTGLRPAYALAVNGTPHPIHDREGIPPSVFQLTLEKFSPDVRDRFFRNMFASTLDYEAFRQHRPQRSWEDQREELALLWQAARTEAADRYTLRYDAALIGRKDEIVHSKNQTRAWKDVCRTRVLDSGHFPFYRWRQWEDSFADAIRR